MTIVTRFRSPWKIAARLGRFSVPACFFARQAGDSGRNGRIRMSGSAGITPEMSV